MDSTVDQQEQDKLAETNSDAEPNNVKSCDRADGEEPVPSSGASTDLKTDCDADSSDSSQTEDKPEEQDWKPKAQPGNGLFTLYIITANVYFCSTVVF